MTSTDKPIHLTGKEYYDLLQKTRREALEEAARLCCNYCFNNLPLRKIEDERVAPTGFVHLVREDYQPECPSGFVHQLIAAEQGQGQTTQAGPVEGNEGYTERELKCAGCMGPCGQCNS